jgi:hypothetical protein
MSNVGQAVLTIGGAVVGGFFGQPQLGYLLGSMAGQALFPTDLGTVKGPRLNDLMVQTSTIGAPISIVFGTYAVSGNLIWSSGIIEKVTRTRQGGKGGPTQTVKTYSYSVNAAVGVCEGPQAGITRIWADAELIYDIRPQQPLEADEDYALRVAASAALAENMEIYLGTNTQLPDPTIESFEGVGNVSAYRDLMYVVFTEFQLESYGNRVPSWRFEVAGEAECETIGAYSAGSLAMWDVTNDDPRVFSQGYEYSLTYGTHEAGYSSNYGGGWANTIGAALIAQGGSHADFSTEVSGWTPVQAMDQPFFTGGYRDPYFPCDPSFGESEDAGGKMMIDLFVAGLSTVADYCAEVDEDWFAVLEGGNVTYHFVGDTGGLRIPGIYTNVAFPDGPEFIGGLPADSVSLGAEKTIGVHDAVVKVRRQVETPPPPCDGETLIQIANYGWWCYKDGVYIQAFEEDGTEVTWTYFGGATLNGLKTFFITDSGSGTFTTIPTPSLTKFSTVTERPLGPFRPNGSAEDTEAFWEAAYDAAVIAGDMEPGLTYGIDYPHSQVGYWGIEYPACVAPPGAVTLGQIVRAICLRCGLIDEQIDVSDLTELVDGYVLGRVMNGRDAIEPLRTYGFFDCVESGGVLKWPKRGKAPVATLTSDDLAAHWGDGERPEAYSVSRVQTVELPYRVRVHYAQTATNYEAGEQGASRLSAQTVNVLDVELPIAMSDMKASQIAEMLLYDRWISRTGFQFNLGPEHTDVEPADTLLVPIDGRMERVRVVDTGHALIGLNTLQAVRDDDGTYVSYAVGSPSANAGGGGSGTIKMPGVATAIFMDLPLLVDSHNDAGYYVAAYAAGGNVWSSVLTYRSPDGGTTYALASTASIQATVGTLDDALPSGPTTVIDETNVLAVTLDVGELESISEASMLAGLNMAAIGADGRWEIIQFRDVVLDTGAQWMLTGLLRGRRGTEWAMGLSQAGDRFVLLDDAIERVPLNIAEIGGTYPHKAVLSGGVLDDVVAVDFVPEGVALEPFSVIDVAATRDSSDDITITWVRRGRIGTELPSGSDIPLSEETEAYEIDVLDTSGSPEVVVRTLTSGTESVVYTEAQQTTDFGSAQPSVTIVVYQMSAVVGRGYPTEATV